VIGAHGLLPEKASAVFLSDALPPPSPSPAIHAPPHAAASIIYAPTHRDVAEAHSAIVPAPEGAIEPDATATPMPVVSAAGSTINHRLAGLASGRPPGYRNGTNVMPHDKTLPPHDLFAVRGVRKRARGAQVRRAEHIRAARAVICPPPCLPLPLFHAIRHAIRATRHCCSGERRHAAAINNADGTSGAVQKRQVQQTCAVARHRPATYAQRFADHHAFNAMVILMFSADGFH